MRSLLTALWIMSWASVALAQTAEDTDSTAPTHYCVSVGVSPFVLADLEVALTSRLSVCVGGGRGLGRFDPHTAYAKIIAYPLMPFNGLQLLLQASYVRDSQYANGTPETGPIPGIGHSWCVGPMIGYKYILDPGLSASFELGPIWYHSRTYFIHDFMWSDDRLAVWGYLSAGWSF